MNIREVEIVVKDAIVALDRGDMSRARTALKLILGQVETPSGDKPIPAGLKVEVVDMGPENADNPVFFTRPAQTHSGTRVYLDAVMPEEMAAEFTALFAKLKTRRLS